MNFGQSWSTALTLFGCLLTFYIQTWEEHHTKTLYLGLVSGPVEGVLSLCVVFLVTAVKGGGHFWEQSVFRTLGIGREMLGWMPDEVYEMPWNKSFLVYGGIILGGSVTMSIHNVLQVRRAKSLSLLYPFLGLTPFLLNWLLAVLYLQLNPSILTHHHLLPLIFTLGLQNSLAVGLIITSHLTSSPFPHGLPLLLNAPLAAGVLASWYGVQGTEDCAVASLWWLFGALVGIYAGFVADVVVSICDYLDIWCLSIKHPWVEEAEVVAAEKKGK
ncbi:hypothetical protein GP486_004186 [Trichoglossum hirsutum]|uniref:Uncharacterized protein n=1 Tax=Trichoglossum hirsutum TaxID=265104 RepID=A0A9P8RPJ7_9PEZI|nr:hypothetical protein GP486_004186 [Trichoglossum hirsutum]